MSFEHWNQFIESYMGREKKSESDSEDTFRPVDESNSYTPAGDAGKGENMEVHTPTFDEVNERAKKQLLKTIDAHLEELKAAFDEYLNADQDKGEQREVELEQYMCQGCGDRAPVYTAIKRAIHAAYPKPVKPAPEIAPPPAVPIVKSAEEARRKGLRNYAIIEEGLKFDVREDWLDPNIDWGGGSVTEIVPTIEDRNRPARMTYEGETYYRDDDK